MTKGGGHQVVRAAFLKALAFVYLAAFLSLLVQVEGLIGRRGILPAHELLEWVELRAGARCYWALPTLLWWIGDGDGSLLFLCGGGAALSVMLLFDVAPAAVLFLSWAFYLSLVTAGQVFLGYQWDALLLETGLLAVFLAPLRLRPRRRAATDAPPSPLVVWLMRFLLFRLMLSSGVVKLRSGDEAWRSLTALQFHYETQPLPTWTAWYAHQLPAWAHAASAAAMFGIELAVPFLMLGPRRARAAAAAATAGLQVLIALTGNYAFFNWLTIALCLLLLDDDALPRRWRPGLASTDAPAAAGGAAWPRVVLVPVAAVVLLLSTAVTAGTVGLRLPWPSPVVALYRALAPFDVVNSYGLFAVMTTTRPEVILEGSADGVTWRPYELRWMPGDVRRAPRFVAPHQPRLDWQMWFAALTPCEPWVVRTMERLREGSPPVSGLLAGDPFRGTPPRFVRAVLYDYRFTSWSQRRDTGAWWRRREAGLYCPTVSWERDSTPVLGLPER